MTMRTDYPRYPRDVREKQIVSRPARERRLAELHLTAYPSVVNESEMPTYADMDDGQLQQKKKTMPMPTVRMGERGVALMSTNQLVARMAEMAREEARQKAESTTKQPLLAPHGRGAAHGVPFDRSSTYRLDYCSKEAPGFHQRVRVIPDHRKDWNETDKANIDAAKMFPYLTMPESMLKNRPTVYRHDYIPEADREDYRTLSHKTNLQDVGTSFAYSAYSIDDPARVVKYDKCVASCRHPRCILWKTYSPRDSFMEKKRTPESTSEELNRLRELRRNQLSRSTQSSSSSGKAAAEAGDGRGKKIVLPGMRGMGSRQAPRHGEEYIYLPRDHFVHQTVYDY
ncbi:hypothetical protein DQ04_07211010 [Trypanosoma grayi]|uniref:hypothetical protein n=1 Tax=Trypanosoma grayi TaxID=71804 RepID=UPI0004F4AEE7|nr:hypothetical protein DQ04_07211010 [Trypanosoma grayi]KEG08426.1 hypothetical protein DQ04_07211010 [Trypanosoma grayi]